MGLTEWPEEVARMYEQPGKHEMHQSHTHVKCIRHDLMFSVALFVVDDKAGSKWWEAVDLHTIDAAGNKLDDFPEAILAIATTGTTGSLSQGQDATSE